MLFKSEDRTDLKMFMKKENNDKHDINFNTDVMETNYQKKETLAPQEDLNNNYKGVKPSKKFIEDIGTDPNYKHQIVWLNLIGWSIIHILGLWGIYQTVTSAKMLTILWTTFIGYLSVEGVTIGAHRLYTHRAFNAKPIVKITLIVFQTIAGQNCLFIWARDHRLHHKFSDTDADPHNAIRGLFFSHIGWLMTKKHPLVIEKGRTIDLTDLLTDPYIMFQKRHYKKLYFLFAIFLPVIVPYYFWNETMLNSILVGYFARYVITLNGTWTVNSLAHIYGTKPFDNSIVPKENTFVGFISSGEGWHNYHHAFPWDYKAAEFGQKFNFSATVIEWLEKHGYAYGLRYVPDDMLKKRIERLGDGTHHKYGKRTVVREISCSS